MNKINHAEPEPIEKASLDELQALQLERMKWSLQHAYDNVAHSSSYGLGFHIGTIPCQRES